MGKRKTELNDVEKQKLQMALSDFEGATNLDIVNKNPGYYYYLAAKDPGHPSSVGACQRLGYEVVNQENNDGEIMPNAEVKTADGGVIQTGDLVLMRIPMMYHEARVDKMVELAKDRADRTDQEFSEAVDRTPNKSVFVFGAGRSSRRE